MDGAHVGIFEKTNEVSFSGFLEGEDSRRLETGLSLDVVSDFLDQSLERKFADQKISGLLVFSDFTGSDGAGAESVGFLDSSGWCGFLGGLGGDFFSWFLDTCG